MTKKILRTLLTLSIFIAACSTGRTDADHETGERDVTTSDETALHKDSVLYSSESLQIRQVSEHVYQHTSYLSTNDFGNVPCNGMIVFNGNEAIVFDTPASETSSEELLSQLDSMGFEVKAVVATHFHADCVAGLKQFHARNIPSYTNTRTLVLLDGLSSEQMPQNAFDREIELMVGGQNVYAKYFGEGHTTDNVIGYFPSDQVLFGGCLIKEMDAGKGNLEDANTDAWPATVMKIKKEYPNLSKVIPGHGSIGGPKLLDYTITLFQ